jgi:hypothetical protein
MVAKAMWVSMLVLSVLAITGLGFAAFTAQSNVTITGTGGTLSLAISNWSTETSASYVNCVGVSNSTSLAITAGPLAPGDWCEVFGNVTNTGNVPTTVLANWPHEGIDSCFDWVVILPTHSATPPVGHGLLPGASEKFQFALGLDSEAGNSCEGAVASVSIFFNATSADTTTTFP